ncbi:hypothetical protein WR25_25199 [Diploscapter pachys]|uniref:Calponin-homology (CH) domain-containing protein n=1 Tax=Diploscapter pachys TaxID=2018661 RepID=A0A2A2M169_9BILA|nr:hypothetical protein WR25_25199 [Diploscapter pachys]
MSTMERDRDRRTPGRDDTMRSKKSESFMEKLSGTLTRKKKPQHDEMGGGNVEVREQTHKDHKDHKDRPEEDEIAEVEYEGREALDHSLVSPLARTERLEEGEQHRYLSKESAQDPKVREVVDLLVYWLNQEMAGERIVVRHIQEDLYDGQVIQKLVEKLADIKIEVPEVSQSEEGQRQKLQIVIGTANRVLQQGYDSAKWSAEMIHDKDVVAIIQLLYALAVHFRAPVRFPENVSAKVVTARKEGGHIKTEHVMEQLTGTQQELGPKGERDAFDTLFDYGPDKLAHVKTSLLAFCNKHLNKINLEVTDLDHQFQDGVFLVLLMGLLEGYFVPLYCFNLQVASYEDKVKNVQFAYKLMEDAGLPKPRSRVQDIANGDLKGRSILMEKKMNKSSDGGGAEDGNLKNSKNGTPKTNESRQQDLNLPPKKEFKQAALTNFFKPVDSAENPSCSPKSHVQPSINSVAATGSSSTISDKSTDSNSSFTVTGSQRKKIEERIKAIERKIASAWARRDYKTYQTHVASASQFPLSVILGIENEIHRFAVVKEKNKVKDREKLKMIASKEQKEEYRKQVAEERKAVYKEMDPKIKAHFNTKILIEDWRISQKNLAPLGKKIDLLPDENALFSECLMLAQIPFSLKGFIQYNGKLHSEELFEALENGEDGFADATYHLLESFCRFFCEKDRRHFMTSTSVKNLPKVLKEQLSLVNISTFTHKILRNMLHRITGKYDTSKSVDKDEDDQIESEAESGRSTPMERYLDDEEELQFLYSEFPEDKEFYQLRPELQIRILIYLADNILHHEVYKSYTADRQGNAPKTIAQLNEEQKHITEELATLTNDLDYAAVDEDTDEEELLTRAEARKREEKRKKAQKITVSR